MRPLDKISSTNPLELLNDEIKQRTDVVVVFRNNAAIIQLTSTLPLERNDESAVGQPLLYEPWRP